MNIKTIAITAIATLTMTITACGDDNSFPESATDTGATATETTASVAGQVTAALDKLGATHTAPARTEVGLGGMKISYEININGGDGYIHIFDNEDKLDAWQDASDSYGGVSVTFGTNAVSLNSTDHITESVALAPRLAKELNGKPHGVDGDAPAPTTAAPTPTTSSSARDAATDTASYTCGDWHLYQAGTAIYSDGHTGYEESCYQPMTDAAKTNQTSYPEYDGEDESGPFVPATPNASSGGGVAAEKQAGQDWWGNCIASNTADYCRSADPWQEQ